MKILILLAAVVAVTLAYERLTKPKPYSCETCKYVKWNCIDEPCFSCEDESRYVKSSLEGQEFE